MATKSAMFLYLNDLRKAGLTDIVDARPYLMRTFDIPPRRAAEVLAEWVKRGKR